MTRAAASDALPLARLVAMMDMALRSVLSRWIL
jgi:hypothetical protein